VGWKRAFSTDELPERQSILSESWELRPDMGAWNDEKATDEQEEGRMHFNSL